MEPIETQPPSTSRPTRLTSAMVAGGAVVAMVLAGLGIAAAQTGETPTPPAPPAATAEAGPGEEAPCHDRHRHHPKAGLTAAAAAIGISEDELRVLLRAGKTIAGVATDKGVAVEKVVTAMADEAKARLATAVSKGRITQTQADARIAGLTEHLTDRVNRPKPAGDERRPGGDGHRTGRGGSTPDATHDA